MKKEIKKLQRFRDQVKQWTASNDVKDKTVLLEYRKKIEIEMERFKVVEKETKTKAFSKEGLAAARLAKDPKEKAKDDAKEWIANAMETMNEQIEVFEHEIESLSASSKKGKSKTSTPGGTRLGQLEESMSRHHQHIARLELCERLVEDDALEPADADDLKDLVEDYLERNQEDFDEFADVEEMYQELDLDELENVAARNKANSVNVAAELALAAATAGADKTGTETLSRQDSTASSDSKAASTGTTTGTDPKPVAQKELKRAPEKTLPVPVSKAGGGGVLGGGAGVPAPLATKNAADGLEGKAIPGPKKEGREGSLGGNGGSWGAPGGADTQGLQQQQSWSFPPGGGVSGTPEQQQINALNGSPQPGPGGVGGSSKFPLPMQQQQQRGGGIAATTGQARPVPGSPSPSPSPGGKGLPAPLQFPKSPARGGDVGGGGGDVRGGDAGGDASGGGDDAFALPAALAELLRETNDVSSANRFGEGLSWEGSGSGGDETLDKAMTADGAPGVLLGGVNHHDPAVNLRLLESSHKNLPRAGDGVWSRRRVDGGGRVGGAGTVSTPADRSPNSYPTALPPVLQNPALFERLDADALFWTFYYQQGTARQCLAARELKRANWRFHKKHATWFARQEEPKNSTEEFERGAYIYFDFSMNPGADGSLNGWCQRSKGDFVFQYSQLESELV